MMLVHNIMQVHALLEESADANKAGEVQLALEKAKEACRKERQLCKHREQNMLQEQINIDLTYAVMFNLGNQYHANDLLKEALNTYTQIVKNKQFSQSGRLRVNIGNIHFEQKKYPQVKNYAGYTIQERT